MKKIYTLPILLFLPFLCFAQILTVQISSSDPLPPLVIPLNHESIGYFNISSDTSVFIEECIVDFLEGHESLDHVYLHVEELPRLSVGQEFLTDPWVHYPSYFLNMQGEENVSFQYFADIEETSPAFVPTMISYSLTCKVSLFGNTNQFVWTPLITVSTPVVLSVSNASHPSGVLIWGRRLFIPEKETVRVSNLLGQSVEIFKEESSERWESLDLPIGSYFVETNKGFGGKFGVAH